MFDVKDTDFFELEDEAFDTIVENDITFTGEVRLKKPFMIRGNINGKIDSVSDLVIDTGSVVNADLKATRVLIKGKVKGNIDGEKLIFVTSSGSLEGDVVTQKFVLEPGSNFTGKCTMIPEEKDGKKK